jgi:phosphate transport system substrate-binding protein
MGKLVTRWIAEFHRTQPDVTFENRMYGTASAIGALAVGAGNIALLGEEISPAAAAEFQRAKGYPPTGIQVATGSLDVNFFDYAHMIFVHRDNPLASLSLTQLEAIFGTERRRGAPRVIRTWGQLGLTGEWVDRPIQPYGWKVDEDFALFFREAVLENSHRWNPAVKEYVHQQRPDGTQYDHGQQILDALAADRFGIAISNIRYGRAEVRALPLAARDGEPAFAPTPANLIAQTYPLVRIIPAFIDHPPGQPVEPVVREFLRYVLSREGQQALIEETGYLPLGEGAIRAQLAKLAGPANAPRPSAIATDKLGAVNSPVLQPPPVDPTDAAGLIRIWGTAELRPLVERWQAAFQQTHPTARFAVNLSGSDVAMAALTTRRTDLALLGRVATDPEVKGFEWIYRYQPARVEVATGSLSVPGHSPALMVYVHRDNPLGSLTLAQLDAAFGNERLRGAPATIRTWGGLGLTGAWADRPIHLYAPDTESGTGRFFRNAVLNDSRLLAWENLREFADTPGTPSTHDAGRKILDALVADPLGLAIACDTPRDGNVKPLTVAKGAAGPFVAATRTSLVERTYPLTRPVFAYINRKPGTPVDPKAREFLEFVLGAEGQRAVAQDGAYLPLSPSLVERQQAVLK